VATRTFDEAGRLTKVENEDGSTVLSTFTWTLDAAGNPTKAQTTRGMTDTYDAFEYDTRNRLTASCYGVSSGASDCTGASNEITYAYDKVSNRTEEVRSGSVGNTGTITYDLQRRRPADRDGRRHEHDLLHLRRQRQPRLEGQPQLHLRPRRPARLHHRFRHYDHLRLRRR
jgi:hypothetical protein